MGGDRTCELSRVPGCLLVVELACAQVLYVGRRRCLLRPLATHHGSSAKVSRAGEGGKALPVLLRTVETNLSNFTDGRHGTDTR